MMFNDSQIYAGLDLTHDDMLDLEILSKDLDPSDRLPATSQSIHLA